MPPPPKARGGCARETKPRPKRAPPPAAPRCAGPPAETADVDGRTRNRRPRIRRPASHRHGASARRPDRGVVPGAGHHRADPSPRVDLAYNVYYGTIGFLIGDAVYRFEHTDNQYRIVTVRQARSLAAPHPCRQGKVQELPRGLIYRNRTARRWNSTSSAAGPDRREDSGIRLGGGHRDDARQQDRARSTCRPSIRSRSCGSTTSRRRPPTSVTVSGRDTAPPHALHHHQRGDRNHRVAARQDRSRALASPQRRRQDRRLCLARALAAMFHIPVKLRVSGLPRPRLRSRWCCDTIRGGRERGLGRPRPARHAARRRQKHPRPPRRWRRREAAETFPTTAEVSDVRSMPRSHWRSRRRSACVRELRRCRRDNALSDLLPRAPRRWGSTTSRSSRDAVLRACARMRSLEALAGRAATPRRLAIAVLVREMGRSAARSSTCARRATDDIWLRAFKSRPGNALPPAVAHDLPGLALGPAGHAYGDADARGARACVAGASAIRLARQSAQDHTRCRAGGARSKTASTACATPYSPLGIRVAGRPSLAQHPWLAGRPARSAGRRQPAGPATSWRHAARTWSSISARAPAARRCCSAR